MKNLYPVSSFCHSARLHCRSFHTGRESETVGCVKNLFRKSLCYLIIQFVIANCIVHAQSGINNFTYLNNPSITIKTYTGPGGGIGAQSEYIPSSNNTWTYNFGLSSGLSSGALSVNGYISGGSSFSAPYH